MLLNGNTTVRSGPLEGQSGGASVGAIVGVIVVMDRWTDWVPEGGGCHGLQNLVLIRLY